MSGCLDRGESKGGRANPGKHHRTQEVGKSLNGGASESHIPFANSKNDFWCHCCSPRALQPSAVMKKPSAVFSQYPFETFLLRQSEGLPSFFW